MCITPAVEAMSPEAPDARRRRADDSKYDETNDDARMILLWWTFLPSHIIIINQLIPPNRMKTQRYISIWTPGKQAKTKMASSPHECMHHISYIYPCYSVVYSEEKSVFDGSHIWTRCRPTSTHVAFRDPSPRPHQIISRYTNKHTWIEIVLLS
jgi:hypothetical protein